MRTTNVIRIAALAALGAFFAAPATADDIRYREQVHADSFGNLVIYAPGGYKRIVVDKGYLAEELAAYGRPAEPAIVHGHKPHGAYRPCRRLPLRAQGRSYMYGLPDHVVPVFTADCG